MFELKDSDYKYVLQDISNVFIGARFTYRDMMENEYVPSRFQDAVCRVFAKEAGEDTMLCDHLLCLGKESESYRGFSQLKIRIKVAVAEKKTDKSGKEILLYPAKDYELEGFMKRFCLPEGEREDILIQEISFKKRHLASMHI